MGQKANPIGNRLGIIRGWDSNWYASSKNFGDNVVEDQKIRRYIDARVSKGGISKVVIERTLKRVTVTIHTSRPGIIIGKGGTEVDRIKEELNKLTSKDVQINIVEIRKPDVDAAIVGESIAKQLESRVNFRRAIKMAIASTIRAGAEGIKIRISGRLNGAEMARTEEFKQGRTPLHTFRADIDYSWKEALTIYGKLGIKTWICRGEIFGKPDLTPEAPSKDQKQQRGPQGGGNYGGNRNDSRGGDRDNRNNDNRGGGDKGGAAGPRKRKPASK